MPIVETTFAPSKKPYAIDFSSFDVDSHKCATVAAVWVGRKKGLTYVSSGFLWTYRSQTLEDFIATFDPRYGGDAQARWNGHDLWAPGFTLPQMQAKSQELDAVLRNLPDVPAGYAGWYRLEN